MRFAHLSLALSLLLLTGPAADAQTAVDPTGHWKGTIDIPNHPVDFEIDLGRNARGELVGTATTPGADHGTFPLLKITLDGERVMFYGRTDQPFQGALSTSAQAIAGTFTFSGYDLPFSLSRTGEARAACERRRRRSHTFPRRCTEWIECDDPVAKRAGLVRGRARRGGHGTRRHVDAGDDKPPADFYSPGSGRPAVARDW